MKNDSIKIAVSSSVLAAEYHAGASLRDLAAKYGCSFQNIQIRLSNANVPMRSTGATRTIPDKACPTCGNVFTPTYRNQVFCCSEHIRKKSVCIRGHELTEENRYHFPSSASQCRQCQHIRSKEYIARKRAEQG